MKRPILLYSAVGAVLILVAGSVLAWQNWPKGDEATAEVSPPTDKPFVAPASMGPVALSTASDTSDEFDWWSIATPAAEVDFLASDDFHVGSYSLVVVSQLAAGHPSRPQLTQSVPITPGETVTVGFWAKAVGAQDGAVKIVLGPDPALDVTSVQGGDYDWTYFSYDYEVKGGRPNLDVAISVEGSTAGTWIDELTIVGSDGGQRALGNGSFESHSAELTVVNDSLLLVAGEASVEVVTRRAPDGWLHWAATYADGSIASEGDVLIEGYRAQIVLADLDPGYFDLAIQSTVGEKVMDRSLPFVVIDGPTAENKGQESPFGVFLHYLGGESRLSNMATTMQLAGIEHVRVEIPWDLVEKTPGVYEYPKHVEDTLGSFAAADLDPLLVPVYYNPNYDNTRTPSTPEGLAAYANYSKDVVGHYGSLGKDLEVYNEFDHWFNNGACGQTPACYMQMLAPTYDAVKSTNPDAVIAGPGNAGMGFQLDWLNEFFALGGLQNVDVVSAHPYVQPEAPEVLLGEIASLRQLIRDHNGGQDKPIWLTEMGWASVPDWVTEEQQAQYLVRTMALSLANGVSRVYWFEAASLSLNPGDRETNFGMLEAPSSFLPNTNAPKPAAAAQAVMARQIAGQPYTASDEVGADTYSYVFGSDKTSTRVMWATGFGKKAFVHSKKPIQVTDMFGNVRDVKPVSGVVELELGGSPIYVSGSVSRVSSS